MASPASSSRPIRLAILDDNPFVRCPDGLTRPRAATFHRFAAAVVAAGPFGRADYLIPVRRAGAGEPVPSLDPVDEARLRIVPTAPFAGIADYLVRTPRMVARNVPVIRAAVSAADLVWIKAPASNAPLVALACRLRRVPRFTYVAGSARAVVGGQERSAPGRLVAGAVAWLYDAIAAALRSTGPSIVLGADLFTSIVTAGEVAATRVLPGPASIQGPVRLAWAGRVAAEKGLGDLLMAIQALRAAGRSTELTIVGEGPARIAVERLAVELGLADAVRWIGYVGARNAYMAALRDAHLFVLPSRAEGLPKVVVEAMAAGLPVVATSVGAVPDLLDGGGRGRLVPPDNAAALAEAIGALADDPAERRRLREAGLAFAAEHTVEAQAQRLVAWMRTAFPALPWPAATPHEEVAA